MKSSYSMPGRTELTVFLKNWIDAFSSITIVSFLKCAITQNTKIENNYNRKTSEKHFSEIESSWGKSIEAFCCRITFDPLCAIGVLQHCSKASSARQSGSCSLPFLIPFCIKICVNWLQICETVKTVYCCRL